MLAEAEQKIKGLLESLNKLKGQKAGKEKELKEANAQEAENEIAEITRLIKLTRLETQINSLKGDIADKQRELDKIEAEKEKKIREIKDAELLQIAENADKKAENADKTAKQNIKTRVIDKGIDCARCFSEAAEAIKKGAGEFVKKARDILHRQGKDFSFLRGLKVLSEYSGDLWKPYLASIDNIIKHFKDGGGDLLGVEKVPGKKQTHTFRITSADRDEKGVYLVVKDETEEGYITTTHLRIPDGMSHRLIGAVDGIFAIAEELTEADMEADQELKELANWDTKAVLGGGAANGSGGTGGGATGSGEGSGPGGANAGDGGGSGGPNAGGGDGDRPTTSGSPVTETNAVNNHSFATSEVVNVSAENGGQEKRRGSASQAGKDNFNDGEISDDGAGTGQF